MNHERVLEYVYCCFINACYMYPCVYMCARQGLAAGNLLCVTWRVSFAFALELLDCRSAPLGSIAGWVQNLHQYQYYFPSLLPVFPPCSCCCFCSCGPRVPEEQQTLYRTRLRLVGLRWLAALSLSISYNCTVSFKVPIRCLRIGPATLVAERRYFPAALLAELACFY